MQLMKRMHRYLHLCWLVLCLFVMVTACTQQTGVDPRVEIDGKQQELDEIYSLLAMSVVHKDWQTRKDRGHNIASILVDPAGSPVFWARNSRYITKNGTQHGEVRLIRNFLNCSDKIEFLDEQVENPYPGAIPGRGFTLYTTLEPCVMCTGMMTMAKVWRAVYVQSDPDFGKVLARLAEDDREHGGHPPYPQLIPLTQVRMQEAVIMDDSFRQWQKSNDSITAWLRSEGARRIFHSASQRLRGFQSRHGNQQAVQISLHFLDQVVDGTFQPDMSLECPQY